MTAVNQVGNALTGVTGTGAFVGATSPTLVTPTLGVASATSVNFGGSTLSTYVSENSFTPAFTFVTPGDLSVVYSSRTGFYTQIGSVVFYNLQLAFTPTFTTSSGAILISGLPIAVYAGITPPIGQVSLGGGFINYVGYSINASPVNSQTQFTLLANNGASIANLAATNITTGVASQIIACGFYFV